MTFNQATAPARRLAEPAAYSPSLATPAALNEGFCSGLPVTMARALASAPLGDAASPPRPLGVDLSRTFHLGLTSMTTFTASSFTWSGDTLSSECSFGIAD